MAAQTPGFGRRLACLLYEALVVLAVLLIGFLLPQAALSGFGVVASGKMLWVPVFGLLMVYFVWFWINGGQTLAMKTWKLRVIDTGGGPLRPLQAVLRYLAAWPSFALLGIGLL